MLRRHRNNPFPSPPVSAAKQLQPTSCVIHQTLYKSSTYHTWPPNWNWNLIPWPGGLTVSCFSGRHGDDWWDCAGGGENGKKKRKRKKRKWKWKREGKDCFVLLWMGEYSGVRILFTFTCLKKNTHLPQKKVRGRRAKSEWAGGREGVKEWQRGMSTGKWKPSSSPSMSAEPARARVILQTNKRMSSQSWNARVHKQQAVVGVAMRFIKKPRLKLIREESSHSCLCFWKTQRCWDKKKMHKQQREKRKWCHFKI